MKTFTLVIFLFLCLIQPYIYGFSVFYIIILLPLVFFWKLYKLQKTEFSLIISMIILIAFNIILGLLKSGEFNQRLIFIFTLNILIFFLSKLIIIYFYDKKTEPYINKTIFLAIFINSIFIIIINLGIINKDIFYSIIMTNPLVFEYPIPRYPGFTYDAFSYISTLTAFCFIFLFRNYFNFKKINILQLSFFSLITLAAIVFSGRTGILLTLIYFLLFLILSKNKLSSIKFSLIVIVIVMLSLSIDWYSFEWMKTWAFGFINNILSGDSIKNSDSSVTGVLQSLFLPKNLLFGDQITFSDVKSDLGFVRLLTSSGIIGLLLTITIFYAPYFFAAVKYNSLVLFILTASLLFLNFKDVYLVSPYGHFVLLNIYFCFSIANKKQKNGNGNEN